MKIDVTTIEGFDGMTPEQQIDALRNYELPEPDYSGYIAKEKFDKTASELAEAKKQLKAGLNAEDQARAAAAAEMAELQEKYAALLKSSTIADHTARFLALGYEEKLARETAEALFDGDMDKVFQNQRKAAEAREKRLRDELLKTNPFPTDSVGSPPPSRPSRAAQIERDYHNRLYGTKGE